MITPIGRAGWLIGLTLIFSSPAFAGIYWGVRAGIARSSLVQKIDLDYWSGSCLGYSAAVLADIPFYQRFSFRPEVAFAYEGGSFYSELLDGLFLQKHRLRSYSLQPSFDVAFNIPIAGVKMTVYGGPTLDFRLCNKLSSERLEEEFAAINPKRVRPFDLGVNTGISVEYKGVFFSITALPGIIYQQTKKTEGESSVFQNNLTFSLGYIFR
ncbi:MAG: PorT family protein [Tannerellaceae bacterium]|jgi:hypothetical protein|nr:PorT family protein [Tannerellaceae bacterium]